MSILSDTYRCLVFLAALFLAVPAYAQDSRSETIRVPNFWDPKGVHDRPNTIPDKFQFLATDAYPPFVFRDAQGRLTGFNVDLARALCIELGSSCSLRIKDFDVLLPALRDEEGDAVISGLSRSAPDSRDLLFTEDYMKLPARFVVRAGRVDSFDEGKLDGLQIAVEADSRYEAFLRKFWPSARLLVTNSAAAARDTVRSGWADAHFGDGLELSFWLRSEDAAGCCQFAGGPWLEPGFFDSGLSIAIRKDEPDRVAALNYALWQIHENGTYQELYLRYFPLSFF